MSTASLPRVLGFICIFTVLSLTCLHSSVVNITPNDIIEAYETAKLYSERTSGDDQAVAGSSGYPALDIAVSRHVSGMKANDRSKTLEKTQKKFEYATQILKSKFDLAPEAIQKLSEIDLKNFVKDGSIEKCESLFNFKCDSSSPYRKINGSCNNIDNPTWGMTSSCYWRLHKPFYADGISEPRISESGKPLPEVRDICLNIHNDIYNPLKPATALYAGWGQFVAHDLALTALSTVEGKPLNCCSRDASAQCDAVRVKPYDRFYSTYHVDCLNNPRAVPCTSCRLGARTQINQETAYLDGSHIYGNSDKASESSRRFDGSGKMKTSPDGKYFPDSEDPAHDKCSYLKKASKCFQGVDKRVNQQPLLLSLHTVFMREHNRIAEALKNLNCGSWSDDRIFEESRRIVIGEVQAITFKEFLPPTIGQNLIQDYDLAVSAGGYTKYDKYEFSGLYSEFVGAAFRFGHSAFSKRFFYVLPNGTSVMTYLKDSFAYPNPIRSGYMDSLLRGLVRNPAEDSDRFIINDLTNHLYQVAGTDFGLDLCSINLKRGRDFGLPPYVEMARLWCGPEIKSFEDLEDIFRPGYVKLFKDTYESVNDIDLFSGGLAEKPKDGAWVGPTFAMIIAEQFARLKFADRFYFEHGDQAGSFTEDQLTQLRGTSLARVICANTDIDQLQERVLEPPGPGNNYKSCGEFDDIDFSLWGQ